MKSLGLMIAAALLTAGLAVAIGSMLAVTVRFTHPLTTLSIVVQRLAARSLSGDSNRLKLGVGKFLNSVHAA